MIRYLFPVIVFTAVACSSKNSQEEEKSNKPVVVELKDEAQMDQRVQELKIIVESSDLIANSLRYEKADGTSIEVIGHIDKTNVLQIVEEIFSDGGGKRNGTIFYYLHNGKPFVTHELIDEVNEQDEGEFVDRISYYDVKGNVIKTKERRASFQDEIGTMSYKPVPLHKVSIDRAMRALNSEGEFETTFQGFVHQDMFSYLIVGENKEDGFTTALRLDYQDKLIKVLNENPKKYLGIKIQVNFENHEDRGFHFQVYAGGKFVD